MSTEQKVDGLAPAALDWEAARDLMAKLSGKHEWVAVFYDRGWGDGPGAADITIIVGGDGQNPLAKITPEAYKRLQAEKIIRPNSLTTYKARRCHDFNRACLEVKS